MTRQWRVVPKPPRAPPSEPPTLLPKDLLSPSPRYISQENGSGVPIPHVLGFRGNRRDGLRFYVGRELQVSCQHSNRMSVAFSKQQLALIAQHKIGKQAREVRMRSPLVDHERSGHEEQAIRRHNDFKRHLPFEAVAPHRSLQIISDRNRRLSPLHIRQIAADRLEIPRLVQLSEIFEAGLEVLLVSSGGEGA